jgi:hypothetical protein
MPYFANDIVNLLLIHIPKTGGESLEKYFSELYNIPLDNNSIYWFVADYIQLEYNVTINSSLQHLTYQTLMKYKDFLSIDTNNLEILTIVRNPYERIVSDLFWFNKINVDTSPAEVYETMKTYLTDEVLDNHNIPQHLFLIDETNQLIKNVTILRTETLTNDMINLGYTRFNVRVNYNKHTLNYYDYLNDDSIQLINCFYKDDFKLFNYDVIRPSVEIPLFNSG